MKHHLNKVAIEIFAIILVLAVMTWGYIATHGDEVGEITTVYLYYYDQEKDMNEAGEVLCSKEGVSHVKRRFKIQENVIKDTLDYLVSGSVTERDRARGISTEFPLQNVSIATTTLAEDGTLYITFNDPNYKTTGGACRASILYAQVEATALQFDEVKSVKILPEYAFQP